MKKRVHIRQLEIGMFVEDFEDGLPADQRPAGGFLIKNAKDIAKIVNSHSMSCIINVRKGTDVAGGALLFRPDDRERLEKQLLESYTAKEVARARNTMSIAAPQVRQLFMSAHDSSTVDMDAASSVVGELMSGAEDNTGALINLLKLKDKDEGTFLHSLSVSILMVTFARALGFGEDTVRDLGIGGLVHDVGKVIVPSNVLKKDGKLDEKELSKMRKHPELGYAMLKRLNISIPPSALDVCLYHHEKFDGSGYPRGLAGENIPYAARLAAVCDVYDALTTIRPYKPAWSQAEALDKMMSARGHFDPQLLKAFVSGLVLKGELT